VVLLDVDPVPARDSDLGREVWKRQTDYWACRDSGRFRMVAAAAAAAAAAAVEVGRTIGCLVEIPVELRPLSFVVGEVQVMLRVDWGMDFDIVAAAAVDVVADG